MAKRGLRRSRMRLSKVKRRTKDISDHTLTMMIILVLVVSVLSATMYMYAFYGGANITPRSGELKSVQVEKQAASGMATIQITKPPEGSK